MVEFIPEDDLKGPGVSLKKSARSKARRKRKSSAQSLGVGNAGPEKEKERFHRGGPFRETVGTCSKVRLGPSGFHGPLNRSQRFCC